ncbi:hypothetical protein J6590_073889 [Homalodisca vitripennis]|nr:hypothetical protein J6590_073889 [Homalodisca vitripennis]
MVILPGEIHYWLWTDCNKSSIAYCSKRTKGVGVVPIFCKRQKVRHLESSSVGYFAAIIESLHKRMCDHRRLGLCICTLLITWKIDRSDRQTDRQAALQRTNYSEIVPEFGESGLNSLFPHD